MTQKTYEDGDTVTYQYDNDGALATITDSQTGITTTHYYDFVDRLASYQETGTGFSHQVGYSYDLQNNLTALKETINGTDYTTAYAYDEDNRITSVTGGNAVKIYTYDTLGRTGEQETKIGETTVKTDEFEFVPNGSKTTMQVAQHTITAPGQTQTYSYTYDDNGNILSVSDGTNTTSYVYDSANQLIRENNQAGGFTHTWTYSVIGNISERKEYAYTTGELGTPTDTIIYAWCEDEWGDLFPAYDGTPITYDEIGNFLTDGTWTYTWQHGRELSAMTNGTATWEYLYNADGLRTQKTNGTKTYRYVYNGSSLSQMTVGEDTLTFFYDAAGQPMSVLYNGTTYFYITNLQGDVIGLLDASGQQVVAYTYDAWGNSLTVTGSMASTLGQLNPLRYRGYVYDEETQLYYLQSRYYNPEIGRFINADAFTSTGQGVLGNNMYAYCNNNPVVRVDRNGQFWESAFDVISLGASIVEVCVNPTDIWAWAGLVGDAVDLIPFVTGVGEVTRAVKTTVKVADKAEDVLDTANTLYKTADAASDIKKATGSYEIVYKSGKNYIGKGSFKRAMTSAKAHAKSADDILSIRWKSAPSSREAFLDEYLMQKRYGGVLSSNPGLPTYNKIWSPGRGYYGR